MMFAAVFITIDLWYVIWVASLRIKLPESFSLPIMAAYCGIFKYLNQMLAKETGIVLEPVVVSKTEKKEPAKKEPAAKPDAGKK